MCQFKSGIAVRISESEVEVRTSPLEDSHTNIREKCNIRENTFGLSRYSTPVELIPTKLDFEDNSCWELVFDDNKPDWWAEGMHDQCIDQLLKAAKEDFDALMSGKEYPGSLDLDSLKSIPSGFNPTVGGSLYLDGLTSIPSGFNPTVGGYLVLNHLTSIPDGFNPTVGGNLYLRGLTSIPSGFNPTVGGNLWLDRLTSIPDSVRKNVKGKVYL